MMWSNVLGVSVRMLLDEVTFRLSKADSRPRWGWASFNQD